MLALIIVLAILAVLIGGLGFAFHFLFWVAAIIAILCLISWLVHGVGGRR